MKKISILIFSLIISAPSMFAQIDKEKAQNDDFGQRSSKNTVKNESSQQKNTIEITTKHYNYELSLGARAGAGLSFMSQSEGLDVADGSGLAFGGGLAANVRFGSKDSKGRYLDGQGLFGVGLELNYKQYGVKTKKDEMFNNDNLSLSYFEVPVLIQLYPLYNTKQMKNLYVEFGPTFSIPLSAKPDQLNYENASYKTGDLKGFDVKASIGLGYRFNRLSANDGLYVNARYNMGMSKLAGNFPAKVSSLELTIGYTFKCIGTKKKSASPNKGNHNRIEL